MKKLDFFKVFFAALFVAAGVWAQDVIYMRNGSEIKAKVLRSYNMTTGNVEFVLSSNGQNSYVSVREVERIQFADGHRVSYVFGGYANANQGVKDLSSMSSSQSSFAQEENDAPSGQRITVKQPTGDADYEKRQAKIVKYTNGLEKMENSLEQIKGSAPAAYEVGKLSVELLKTLNRAQEQKYFESAALVPLIIKATLMSIPSQVTQPIKTNIDKVNPELIAKVFPFLTVNFKLSPDKATGAVISTLKEWNGKSVWDIKGEMQSAPPMDKVKVGLVLKNSTGIFANVIPQLNVTVKSSM